MVRAGQMVRTARRVPSGAACRTVVSGPRSRTTARSPGSSSASLTRAAASSFCAPLETAMATARRRADSRSEGRATAAGVWARRVSSRRAAPSDAAIRALEDLAKVMILRSSVVISGGGPDVSSLTRPSVRGAARDGLGAVLGLPLHQYRADLVAAPGSGLRGQPQAVHYGGGARDGDAAERVGQQPGHRLYVLGPVDVDAEELLQLGHR